MTHPFLEKLGQIPKSLEKSLRALFEDVPESISVNARGHGLQGIEITAHIGKRARIALVALDEGKRYLPDSYLVHLSPEDHDKLRVHFEDLRQDGLIHLEKTCRELKCLTKNPFTIDFVRSRETSIGKIRVETRFENDEIRTVLTRPGETMDAGMNFKTEGFDVAPGEWRVFEEVFRRLEGDDGEGAASLLEAEGLDREGHRLGRLAGVLACLTAGDFIKGARRLHLSPELAESEHGLFVKTMVSFAIGDYDGAERFLGKAHEQHVNPMGALLQCLLAKARDNEEGQETFLQLASMDPVIREIIEELLPEAQSISCGHQTAACVLIDDEKRQRHVLVRKLPFDLSPSPEDATRWKPLQLGRGALTLFAKGTDHLKMVGRETTRLNGSPCTNGALLSVGDRVTVGNRVLVYGQIRFTGSWRKDTDRDFTHPCHLFQSEDGSERWYVAIDPVFTIGREPEQGNDIWFEERNEISGRGHAEISFGNNTFRIKDLGSRNGSLKNGSKLTGRIPRPLAGGDRLQLANKELRVELLEQEND